MDKALRASDELEKALVMRIEHEYGKETLKAIGDLKGFFRDVEALERKKPPVWMDEAAQKRWKRRELDALVQKHRVESRVMKAIRTAGAIAAPLIWDFLARVYGENASQTVEEAQKAQVRQGLAQNAMHEHVNTAQNTTQQQPQQNFVPQQQREIEILLHDQQPPFSKIAFDNLQQAPALLRRLQSEMRQAILNGEGQDKIRQRIQRVMQNGAYNARRIAQTERTRIQSQARWDVMRNAAAQGIPMEKMWIARMKNTRDSHADLNRRTAKVDEPFTTIWGNELMYPGDPNAQAREVINCHCVLIAAFRTTKELPSSPKHDILQSIAKEAGNIGVHYVGKINRAIYKFVETDITTDEVIISDERILHVKERHPNDYERYFECIKDMVENPQRIIETPKPHTAFIIKKYEDLGCFRLIVRLHTSEDKPEWKNSIITFQHIHEKEFRRLKENKKSLYSKE